MNELTMMKNLFFPEKTEPAGGKESLTIERPDRIKRILQILTTVFSNTVEGIVVTDASGIIRRVNPAFTAITGYASDEVLGKNPRILKSDRHDDEFYRAFWEALITTGKWEGEIWNRRKSGEVYPEWMSVAAVYNEEGVVTDYISVFNDLSEVRFKNAKVELRADYDQLTGLSNRRGFYSRMKEELKRLNREERFLVIMVLNLNRFRNINNSLGHAAGDSVLQQVGARLAKYLGTVDRASRMGGDNFHIFLNDIRSVEEVGQRAAEILSLFNEPVEVSGNKILLSAGLGIAVFPDDGRKAETLIQKADMAMIKAKEVGISAFSFFTPELEERASSRLMVESSLRTALAREEFRLAYQPKFDLQRRRISGWEALIRWHSSKGVTPPAEFIPAAEETGLILPIGEWVFREVCRQIREWTAQGYPPPEVAVNLSARQFRQGGLLRAMEGAMKDFSISPRQIGVEVTESGLMENMDGSARILADFKDLGMKVYVDDFGTGYSSLNYLKRLPIDVLKIDKSFVDGVAFDGDDGSIARAVIALGHTLGLGVLAEGVETKEQLDFLEQNGCDEIQGYLFSHPLPPEEVLMFIKKNHDPLFKSKSGL